MENPKTPQKMPYVKDMKAGTYYWCACGQSNNQPFCDGSHEGTSFEPIEEVISEDRKVAWCGCKHSDNKPYCDGNHKSL